VAIGEGQNRELRRFFAHFNAEVVDLKRLSFGGIELNNLPTGKVRFLERNEYTSLRSFLDGVEKAASIKEKQKRNEKLQEGERKPERKFSKGEYSPAKKISEGERKPEKKFSKEKSKPERKPSTKEKGKSKPEQDFFSTNKYKPEKKFGKWEGKK